MISKMNPTVYIKCRTNLGVSASCQATDGGVYIPNRFRSQRGGGGGGANRGGPPGGKEPRKLKREQSMIT